MSKGVLCPKVNSNSKLKIRLAIFYILRKVSKCKGGGAIYDFIE